MLALMLAVSAAGAESVENLIAKLKTSDDFRVRTQAALALGASNSQLAVDPLCGALTDGNEAVRGASAAALAKLGRPEGLPCLKAKVDGEQNANVKAQMQKSIKILSSKVDGAIPDNARYYVAIGKTNNKTSRAADDLDALVRQTMANKLRGIDGVAVAPKNETAAAAKKIIDEKKLKGLALQVTVEEPKYDGGTLSVSIKVLILTYPGKDIKGGSSGSVSQGGASQKNRDLEDQLLRAILEDSVDKFNRSMDSM